jgi:hypothetical protein
MLALGAWAVDEGIRQATGGGAGTQQPAQAPPTTNFRPPPQMPSAFDAVNPKVRFGPNTPTQE